MYEYKICQGVLKGIEVKSEMIPLCFVGLTLNSMVSMKQAEDPQRFLGGILFSLLPLVLISFLRSPTDSHLFLLPFYTSTYLYLFLVSVFPLSFPLGKVQLSWKKSHQAEPSGTVAAKSGPVVQVISHQWSPLSLTSVNIPLYEDITLSRAILTFKFTPVLPIALLNRNQGSEGSAIQLWLPSNLQNDN